MMRQICIHNDNEVSCGMFNPMHISCAQPKFFFSWSQDNFVLTVHILQLFGHIQCSIWRTIVYHDYLIIQIARMLYIFT